MLNNLSTPLRRTIRLAIVALSRGLRDDYQSTRWGDYYLSVTEHDFFLCDFFRQHGQRYECTKRLREHGEDAASVRCFRTGYGVEGSEQRARNLRRLRYLQNWQVELATS